MSNQGYYGGGYGQPAPPQQAYYGPPQQQLYYGPPQGNYGPPQGYQQQQPPPRRERGCFEACLATLCCCFVCEEGCETCADCCLCCEDCC